MKTTITNKKNKANLKRSKRARLSTRNRVIISAIAVFLTAIAGFVVWYYWWTNYTEFDYSLHSVVILEGWSVTPDEFISPIEETQRISADWSDYEAQSFQTGKHDVPLLLKQGLRSLEATATLYVMKPFEKLTVEYKSTSRTLHPVELISNAYIADFPLDVHFISEPQPLDNYYVGEHKLQLILNGAPFEVILIIEDTIPPEVITVNREIPIGEQVVPEDFIEDIVDVSPILSIEFINEPDISEGGTQTIWLEATDIHGNTSRNSAELTVLLNETPPFFEGLDAITIMKDGSILYRQGVTAFDDFGRELDFEVDNTQVDQGKVGTYEVIYSAVDLTGLITQISIPVHVISIDPDVINEWVDGILEKILTDNMTQVEQLRAIYRWIGNYLSFSSYRRSTDSTHEAVHYAMRHRRGNCYVFYSTSELMLTRSGIPNMRIERVAEAPSSHLWNLVNPDNKGWYHFDSWLALTRSDTYMFTQSQAEDFSRQFAAVVEHRLFYTFDPSLYPTIVY